MPTTAPPSLWLHFFDPHLPYAPPERFLGDPMVTSVIGRSFDRLRSVRGGYFVPDEDQRYAIRELYRGEIRWVDEAVGRVVAALRAEGLYDDTLLVLTSDHGEELWDHGGFEHGHTLYNELLHVPLWIKPVGDAPRHTVAQRVATASVFATVRGLAGISSDLPFAVSPTLEPLLVPGAGAEPSGDLGEALAFSTGTRYYEDLSSVQFGRHKYIVAEEGAEQLYDLAADPGESRALAASDEQAAAALLRGRELLAAQRAASEAVYGAISGSGEDRELDAQTLRRLRSLGYVQ